MGSDLYSSFLSIFLWQSAINIYLKQLKSLLVLDLVYITPEHSAYVSEFLKVGLSPSKKICVICFIESLLKMIKNAFYFILKALFVEDSQVLSWLFGHVEKRAWLKR